MRKAQFQTEEHHRRPRSLGGSTNTPNISYVNDKMHKAWHVLFGNMNAMQICKDLNKIKDFVPEGFTIVCKFINGTRVEKFGQNSSKNKNKRSYALYVLFKGLMNFEEKIQFINNTWLDPSYHFYTRKKK
jgi:hypothetical protein